jgi:Radical SAM superfamily
MSLNDIYTSTGSKFFAHEEAMTNLRNGRGQPITTHVMLTDICNHSCAFCSVQARAGDSLVAGDVMEYLGTLKHYGLKSVILSGGGNPILYKCKKTVSDFNSIVTSINRMGLEIGLITNGMPLMTFPMVSNHQRQTWKTVRPETLDKLTWVRISMAGLDHDEREVYVPDIDHSKTTLGFSYVAHDLYIEPADPHHGKVSRPLDILSGDCHRQPNVSFEDRVEWLVEQFKYYVDKYKPSYLRLLPNCLEPPKIEPRCKQLQCMADEVNEAAGREVVFVQYKPPAAPKACLLGVIHPVLNCDGYVYPCDSCVLNETAGHKFGETWRVCHWSEIAKLYENPLPRSLIADTHKQCPGCVFTRSNEILGGVRDGIIIASPPQQTPDHVNFV